MTATAPVSHFMMDAPGFNDQMELTSDHPNAAENVDDFDIDIDLMQDQEPDNDVIVDDALPPTEELEAVPEHMSDGQQDADMLDEDVPEEHASANPPYEQYQEGYHQPEGTYYDNNNSYEAEMVDGFEEEIEKPLPNMDDADHDLEQAEDISRENVEEEPLEPPENEQIHTETTKPFEGTVISEAEATHTREEEIPKPQPEQEETLDQESQPVQVYSNTEQEEITNQEHADIDDHAAHDPKSGRQTVTESETLQVTEDAREAEIAPDTENAKKVDNELEYQDEDQSEVVPGLPSPLTIKVLYQDNEISLFPPREGDSSETFFLEDEGLASENLSELLKACRQVLGDYIGEGEQLTFDIDPLNLHLTEVITLFPKAT